MVHTKIYKNITLGQILMIMMVANIMLSLFMISAMLFNRDNPSKITQQINQTSEKNKQFNKATLQSQSELEQRLESNFRVLQAKGNNLTADIKDAVDKIAENNLQSNQTLQQVGGLQGLIKQINETNTIIKASANKNVQLDNNRVIHEVRDMLGNMTSSSTPATATVGNNNKTR